MTTGFKRRRREIMAILTILFLSPVALNAQIENEIKSFVDSTELMVINGRKLMIKHTQEKDYNKIAEAYYYLNNLTSGNDCDVFTYAEDLFVDILTGDWIAFLSKAENYSDEITKPMCYQVKDQLGTFLFNQIKAEWEILIEETNNTDLSDEEKSLFEAVIYLIGNTQDEEFDAKIKDFEKKYPQSKYNNFVKQYLPQPYKLFSIPFGLGATQVFPTGKLGAFFKQTTDFSLSMDFYFTKWFGGLQLTGGNMGLRGDLLSDKTEYSEDFYAGDKFSYTDVGVTLGYNILKSKNIHIAPYLYLGGTTLMSNLFEGSKDDDLEFQVINSFFVGSGLRFEWKILDFGKGNNYTDIPDNSLALRFDAGYNYPVTFKFTPARGGVFYTRLSLIYWIGTF